jgi:FKBP-type peptidyl-prolyl cis-trans isomerase FkpA
MPKHLTLVLILAAGIVPGCRLIHKPKPVRVERAAATTPGGVQWHDLLVGTGEPAREGDRLTVEYVARLADGTPVDATADRGTPFEFVLGEAPVQGWNEGLVGMREGGKRRLDVPAELAYGAEGWPGLVPPNAPMRFEIELTDVAR